MAVDPAILTTDIETACTTTPDPSGNPQASGAIAGAALASFCADIAYPIAAAINSGGGGGGVTSVGGSGGIVSSGGTTPNITCTYGTTANTVCQGNDSRLTLATNACPQSRTLTAGTGLTGGGDLSADRTFAVDTSIIATRSYADTGDANTLASAETYADGVGVAAVVTAASSAAGLYVPLTRTVTAGTGLTGGGALSSNITLTTAYGTTGTTSCVGNDARLSDARTPTSHATTHLDNGSDPIPVATTSRTGLAPVLSNVSTQFLNGVGSYAVPAGTSVNPSGTGIPHVISGTTQAAASLIVDADVSGSAAIAASKVVQATGTGIPHVVSGALSAASSLIVNADVDAAAAIAASKVVQATGTGIPHVVSGALSAASSLIVNADVDASAAIAASKLATMTATVGGVVPTPPNNAGQYLDGTGNFSVPAGTYSPPTGTGIPHVVAGAVNAAASLIVNADVSTTAAIAVSKIAGNGYAAVGTPIHQYKCNEASGSGSTLTDSGTGGNNATLTGTEGTDWGLASNGLWAYTPSLYMYSTTNTTVATATIADFASASSGTLVCTMRLLGAVFPSSAEVLVSVEDGAAANYFFIGCNGTTLSAPTLYAQAITTTGGAATTTATQYIIGRGTLYTVAAVWTHATGIAVWVNGYLFNSAARAQAMGALTKIRIGNVLASGTNAYQGWLGDVRLYNSALTKANLIAYDEAARRL